MTKILNCFFVISAFVFVRVRRCWVVETGKFLRRDLQLVLVVLIHLVDVVLPPPPAALTGRLAAVAEHGEVSVTGVLRLAVVWHSVSCHVGTWVEFHTEIIVDT